VRENGDITYLKTITTSLSKQLESMKQTMGGLSTQSGEKDAEIIRLNMHLGEQRKVNTKLERSHNAHLRMSQASMSNYSNGMGTGMV